MGVTVDDLIKLFNTQENKYGGATGKPRELNVSINGNFCGCIESAKLDGHGDGLVADVTLELEAPKMVEYYENGVRAEAIDKLRCKLITYLSICQQIEQVAIVRDVLCGVIEIIDEVSTQMIEVEE